MNWGWAGYCEILVFIGLLAVALFLYLDKSARSPSGRENSPFKGELQCSGH